MKGLNIVAPCGWLEYFGNNRNNEQQGTDHGFRRALEKTVVCPLLFTVVHAMLLLL